jgi:uncharacterized protein with HEPN domain
LKIDRTDVLLDRIRDAATNAVTYIEGLHIQDFLADSKTRDAVSMCLIIIGENVARLAKFHPEFLTSHPETPWAQAIGMRNRFAHGYEEIDFTIVWRTAKLYLLALLNTLPPSTPFVP